MTLFDNVSKGTNHLQVFWTRPKYHPYWYQQTTSCRFLCDYKSYYLTEIMIDQWQTSSITQDLHPGSACLIKLVAVYNPSSTDPGIGLSAHTLLTSKC